MDDRFEGDKSLIHTATGQRDFSTVRLFAFHAGSRAMSPTEWCCQEQSCVESEERCTRSFVNASSMCRVCEAETTASQHGRRMVPAISTGGTTAGHMRLLTGATTTMRRSVLLILNQYSRLRKVGGDYISKIIQLVLFPFHSEYGYRVLGCEAHASID